MKRLFFLLPDLQMAQMIMIELNEVGIKKKDVHVIGGTPETLQNAHIPGATFIQTTEALPTLKRGLLLGTVFTLAIFVMFEILLIPAHIKYHALAILGNIVFGMGFGFWLSGMITLSKGVTNPIIQKYAEYIEDGHYVMMIDASPDREQELTKRIVQYHPGAEMAMKTVH